MAVRDSRASTLQHPLHRTSLLRPSIPSQLPTGASAQARVAAVPDSCDDLYPPLERCLLGAQTGSERQEIPTKTKWPYLLIKPDPVITNLDPDPGQRAIGVVEQRTALAYFQNLTIIRTGRSHGDDIGLFNVTGRQRQLTGVAEKGQLLARKCRRKIIGGHGGVDHLDPGLVR